MPEAKTKKISSQKLEQPEIIPARPSNKKVGKSKNIGMLYKVIALSFVALTLVLSLVVLFISSAKTTITIVPKDIDVSAEENIEILLDQDSPNELQISGKLLETNVELTDIFNVSEGETKDAPAVGWITIVNNYSKSQPLIATTRFLSTNNVLFRLKNTVTVPAGEKVTAEIYADQPGIAGEIGPTKFTIPGLRTELQSQIYATSDKATTGGTRTVGILKQTDVDLALEAIKAKVLEEGLAKLNLDLAAQGDSNNYKINPELVFQEITDQKIDAEIGEETSGFEITLKSKLTTVAINEDNIFEIIKNKLEKNVPAGYKLSEINKDGFAYSLDNYDTANGIITTKASLSGKAIVSDKDNFINKDDLVGLTKAELDNYFAQKSDTISKTDYKFSPFWLKHAAANKDKIKIIVQ